MLSALARHLANPLQEQSGVPNKCLYSSSEFDNTYQDYT